MNLKKQIKSFIKELLFFRKENKYLRGERILKKLLANTKSPKRKKLLELIIEHDPENAGNYFVKNFDLNRWSQFKIPTKGKKNVSIFLQADKSRYYEFFLLIFDMDSKHLYKKNNDDLKKIRKDLITTKSNFFLKDQIKEFERIFNKDINLIINKNDLMNSFEQNKSNDEKLFNHINEVAPFYIARKFLYLDLKSLIRVHHVRNYLKKVAKIKRNLIFLDYGCGSGDKALFSAINGDLCTICDIGEVVNATKKRFEIRNLPVNSLEASSVNPIVNCGNNFDIIVCDEVIEHIRHPFELLKLLKKSLAPHGILLLGSFPFNPTDSFGDHLEESVNKREEINNWIFENFESLNIKGCKNIFKKKK